MALAVDYVHSANRDMFLARNLNPMVRANTSRTGPIVRLDAFGVLGESYPAHVWLMENTGDTTTTTRSTSRSNGAISTGGRDAAPTRCRSRGSAA